MPQGQPNVRETYAAFERERQKHARKQRLSEARYNRMQDLTNIWAEVALPFGDEMDIDL